MIVALSSVYSSFDTFRKIRGVIIILLSVQVLGLLYLCIDTDYEDT